MRFTLTLIGPLTGLLAAAPGWAQDDTVYSLYRASEKDRLAAIHVATFEAANGTEDNGEICRQVVEMLMAKPEVELRYWCKPGRALRSTDQ